MRTYTKAFSISAKWGYENQSWNKVENHKATYKLTRQSVPELPSSLVQGARDCACECLKAIKCETLPERKPLSAMRYNQRVITINLIHGIATIASIKGRIKATFFVPSHYRDYLTWAIKSSTISYDRKNKIFYLHVSLEHSDPDKVGNLEVLGIDRGKQIANSEYTIFALEALSKIRVQKRRGKEFNRKLNIWPFYQLEQFIRYKAEALGKHTLMVDARYTSQKCSNCGHVYKGNREGSNFRCRKCGFELHADLNASRNIAQAGIACLSRLSCQPAECSPT